MPPARCLPVQLTPISVKEFDPISAPGCCTRQRTKRDTCSKNITFWVSVTRLLGRVQIDRTLGYSPQLFTATGAERTEARLQTPLVTYIGFFIKH